MIRIYEEILKIINSEDKTALCTVISTKGSTPLKAGSKMIVWNTGRIYGTVGGGSLERQVIENAKEIIDSMEPKTFKHELLHEHGMCCGGTVEIFIEPIASCKNLYIFGAGHIGKSLVKFAKEFDFAINLIDQRDELFADIDTNEIKTFHIHHNKFLNHTKLSNASFVVICTHDHTYDREILAQCIKQPLAYLGMIGSLRKIKTTHKLFLSNGIASEEELTKVDMPIGYAIGAKSPDEIAISILAKLIQVKNRKPEKSTTKPFIPDNLIDCNDMILKFNKLHKILQL